MRVLHVSPFYEPAWAYGGTARAVAALCRALVRRGHEVTVATLQYNSDQPEDVRDRGVRERRFWCPAPLQRRLFPWTPGLRRFLAAHAGDFDLAHVHGHRNGLAVVAVAVLGRSRLPWVLQPHGSYPHHGRSSLTKQVFDRLFGARTVRGAAALIAVSDAEADELPAAARVVPNGVEPVGSCTSARTGLGSRLLFVGSAATRYPS
jgi:glycosyltransferase involved in cell wall biosynthesis